MYRPVKLPYSYSALEPFIDSKTMDIHYNKHYIGYMNKLNDQIKEKKLKQIPILDLIKNINKYSDDIRNNAGGYFNHSLFWYMLKPNNGLSSNKPTNVSYSIIKRDFGNYENFKNKIKEAAKKRFGSGWVWWIMYPNGKTAIVETPYQDNPLMFYPCTIILGIDVWEHAYYLKYQSERENYINNIFNIVNWDYTNNILD